MRDDRYTGRFPQLVPVTQHERALREMRCVVCDMPRVTLHHCHGGSMIGIIDDYPGIAQRANPFFQIPLHAQYHVGSYGIDGAIGVKEWEVMFGSQLSFLHEVNGHLTYDVFQQARLWVDLKRKGIVA